MKTQKHIAIMGILAVFAITLVVLTACENPIDLPAPTLTGITASYTGTTVIYPTTPLNDLKAGLTVTAQYSDKTSTTLASTDYNLSGTLTVGTSTVTVTYEGTTTTFTVTVIAVPDPELSGAISISPDTGVTVNTELTATYTDGAETVSFKWNKNGTVISGAVSNKYTPTTVGSYTVTVSASGFQSKTSAAVTVTAIPTLSGAISISPNTGVTINTELTATYTNGAETVSFQWNKNGTAISDAVSNKYTPAAMGSYTVTVSATGFQSKTSAAVDVSDPSLSTLSGSITINPASAVTGTELTAAYTGSETVSYQWYKDEAAISDAMSNKYTPTEAGSYTVTVSATGYNSQTSAAVTVTAPTLTGITLNTASVKKAYHQNEQLDLSGLIVTANYSNNTSAAITGYTSSPADGAALSTTGTITVTVSYTDEAVTRSNTFSVTVTAPTLTSITLNTASVKKDYEQNETLNLSGLIVTANYSDSTSAAVTGYTTNPANGATLATTGTITVTVSYTEGAATRSGTFTVTVTAGTLTGITAMYTQGSTIIYSDTPLNNLKAGLTVKAQYSAGGENTLSQNDYTLSGTLNVGSSAVTVSYGGKTAIFNVTVTDGTDPGPPKTLTSITLNTTSVRRDYVQDEQLTLSGLVVTANYSDSTSAAVTVYTSSPAEGATLSTGGTITVTVSYTEGAVTRSNTFTVTVGSPTPGLAYELITSGGNANTYRVRKGSVSSGAVIIPATYNGLPVTEIGSADDYSWTGAFYNTSITSVTIPASVTSIGLGAFASCGNLASITIPAGVTAIGNLAFNYCTSLVSITLPVTTIIGDDRVFEGCTSLTTVTFIDGSSTTIDSWFSRLSGIITVNIPASVTAIGDFAFYECSNITTVNFAVNSQLESIGRGAFYQCASLTSIAIPAGVTSIGEYAFNDCDSLATVTFMEGIESIGSWFSGLSSITTINIPASVTTIGDYAFGGTGITEITIPAGVTSIGDWAFGYTGITSIEIPAGVTSIGLRAFYSCTSLTSITIPAGVTSIGTEAFSSCDSLTSVNIAANVTSFGYRVFYDCDSITTVTFMEGVENTGIWFIDLSSITTVHIPASVTTIVSFSGCTGITEITIPASVTSIGYNAFDGWTSSQTIYVEGYGSETAANAAWGYNWRYSCNAVIVYRTLIMNFTVTNTDEWNAAVTAITNGGDNQNSTITISGDVGVAGNQDFGYVSNLTVTLKGSGRLYLTSNGCILDVFNNQTLIIDSPDLTLQGRSYNNSPLITIRFSSAKLELRNGTIWGNTYYRESYDTSVAGGGVYVASGGSFTMSGGEISGNTVRIYYYRDSLTSTSGYAYGGGVHITDSSSFTMTGGTISGNTAEANITYRNPIAGGSNSRGGYAYGGGVSVSGSFTMTGGTISGNTANGNNTSSGGGVYVYSNGTFRIVNGAIYGSGEGDLSNTATNGAALYGTAQRGTFSGETWSSSGNLSNTNDTVRVVNGELE